MKIYAFIGVLALAIILQISLLPALRPFGVVPELVLVVISAAALAGPIVQAMTLAVISGFLLDLVSGSDFGLHSGLLAIAVILCAFVRRSGFQLGLRPQLMIVTLAISTLGAIIMLLEIILAGGRLQLMTAVMRWGIVLGLDMVLVLLVGPICAKLGRTQSGYGEME